MKEIRRPLSRRETALILILLLLAFSLLGWRFIFASLLQVDAELRREHADLLLEQERMLDQLQRGEALSVSWEEQWGTRAEALQRAVPSPERLPEVLATMETLLTALPVTLHTLQIGEIETGEAFATLPVMLRASGEAAALLILLERLEQFEHLLLIDQIDWSRGEEEAASMDLSFILIFHPPP